MTRIEKEKQTVSRMVELYCRSHRHAEDGLCEDCAALLAYAHGRLDRCRFGNRKSTCRKCPVALLQAGYARADAPCHALCRSAHAVASPHSSRKASRYGTSHVGIMAYGYADRCFVCLRNIRLRMVTKNAGICLNTRISCHSCFGSACT